MFRWSEIGAVLSDVPRAMDQAFKGERRLKMCIEDALMYATKKHTGQKRKNGSEYIFHPIAVCKKLKEKGYPIEYQIAGLFHDLLEDTDATEEEILLYSNEEVLEAVKLLTKTPNTKSKEYIKKILENPIAKAVKNEDRIHNLQEATNGDENFINRYLKNTEEYYYGKFSDELDETYSKLKKLYHEKRDKDNIVDSYYTIDVSIDDSPVYKTEKDISYIFTNGEWKECDPFFWAEMGDNALVITEEEALSRIHS